jgi:hypothetical protein
MNNKSLIKYFNEKNLTLSWYRILRWNDKSSKDIFGIKSFDYDFSNNIKKLSSDLISMEYVPTRPEKFFVPKSSLMQRTKTILNIQDAIVYQAIANMVGMLSYEKLGKNNNFVFGSVLCPEVKRGELILDEMGKKEINLFFFQHYAAHYKKFAKSVNQAIVRDKVVYKLETDITGFFDSIPHYCLLSELSNKFLIEDEVLDILDNCLNMWSGTAENKTPGVGIPQSIPPSYLLANILLHELDNTIIKTGMKYCRYMDDMRVYGYSERELIEILLKIDTYLKSIGLSLNSKKTNIEKCDNSYNDSSIIKFFNYIEFDDSSSKDFEFFSEQDQFAINENNIILNDDKEIEDFWRQELDYVEEELPKLFCVNQQPGHSIKVDESVEDRQILNFAYKYRVALKKLCLMNVSRGPNVSILKYWISVLESRCWRSDQICWVLNYYKNNSELKNNLLSIYKHSPYEWVRYQVIQCLSVSQNFTSQELKELLGFAIHDNSNYAKLSLYNLLLFHNIDDQFFSSVYINLKNEKNIYLKKLMSYYIKLSKDKLINKNEIMEIFYL